MDRLVYDTVRLLAMWFCAAYAHGTFPASFTISARLPGRSSGADCAVSLTLAGCPAMGPAASSATRNSTAGCLLLWRVCDHKWFLVTCNELSPLRLHSWARACSPIVLPDCHTMHVFLYVCQQVPTHHHPIISGEIHELKEELASLDRPRKKDAVKKVIAAMTVGKDVSMLFPSVVNCMQTDDLELKKLVYLYLINYAKTQPDLAIMAVNTFVKARPGLGWWIVRACVLGGGCTQCFR
jgi:hypothetical protein